MTKKVLAALVAWSAPALVAAQCSMCKTALTQSEEGRLLAAKIGDAIIFLLLAPYLLLFTLVAIFVVVRARQQKTTPVRLLRAWFSRPESASA